PETFGGLNRSTVQEWIDYSGERAKWKSTVMEKVDQGNDPGHTKGGRRGILSRYPEVVTAIKARLQSLRDEHAPITVVTARGVMLATIMEMAPEILEFTFKDGSKFAASDSYVRAWLHDALTWSPRKGTRVAHKLPDD
ncbi:hypothetical protein C8J56DRAFT_729350, partial [Mycena floridula]